MSKEINKESSMTIDSSPQNFYELQKKAVFVDKTLLIRDIINNEASCLLFTRPRCWGKTLNLNMLRIFFEINIDLKGRISESKNKEIFFNHLFSRLTNRNKKKENKIHNIAEEYMNTLVRMFDIAIPHVRNYIYLNNLEQEQRENYPYQELIKEIENSRQIIIKKISEVINNWMSSQSDDSQNNFKFIYQRFSFTNLHQGKNPIIYITFNSLDEQSNEPLYSMKRSISAAYNEHKYILTNLIKAQLKSKSTLDKDMLQDRINMFKQFLSLKNNNLSYSIKFLSEELHLFFNRKVIVLIDAYDSPLISSYETNHYNTLAQIMRNMLTNGLKNNPHVDKSIITGILRITQADLFCGLNNFQQIGLETSKYSEYYGFTESEVERLLIQCDLESELQNVKDFYNGYKIGGQIIYNPFSLMQYLFNSSTHTDLKNALKPYWQDSGELGLLTKIISGLNDIKPIQELFETKRVSYYLNPYISMEELKEENNYNCFFSLLFQAGFLTKISEGVYEIPNQEVFTYLCKNLLPQWIKNQFILDFRDEIQHHNIQNGEEYKEYIKYVLQKCNFTSKKLQEIDFRTIFNGALIYEQSIQQKYQLKTQHFNDSKNVRERLDTLILPKNNIIKKAIIQEYKVVQEITKVNKIIEETLWQVYMKKYINAIQHEMNASKEIYIEDILIRIIIFYFDQDKQQWTFQFKELSHTLVESIQINQCIQSEKLCKEANIENLIRSENLQESEKIREKILIKYKANSIIEFVQNIKYIQQKPKSAFSICYNSRDQLLFKTDQKHLFFAQDQFQVNS